MKKIAIAVLVSVLVCLIGFEFCQSETLFKQFFGAIGYADATFNGWMFSGMGLSDILCGVGDAHDGEFIFVVGLLLLLISFYFTHNWLFL